MIIANLVMALIYLIFDLFVCLEILNRLEIFSSEPNKLNDFKWLEVSIIQSFNISSRILELLLKLIFEAII